MLFILTGCGDKKESDEEVNSSENSKKENESNSTKDGDYKDIIENFTNAINNSSKIDSFVDKYFDKKAMSALLKIHDSETYTDDEKALQRDFIEEYNMMEASEYSDYEKELKKSLKHWKDRKITVLEIGDLEDAAEVNIDGFKQCNVKFQEFEGNEISVDFLFYKNKIVAINDGAVVEASRVDDTNKMSDVEQVLAEGDEAKNAKLGFIGSTAPDEIVKEYNAIPGVYVDKVVKNKPGSNTVMVGDIITEFNGERVLTVEDLEKLINKCKEGDTVTVRAYSRTESKYKTWQFTFFNT